MRTRSMANSNILQVRYSLKSLMNINYGKKQVNVKISQNLFSGEGFDQLVVKALYDKDFST